MSGCVAKYIRRPHRQFKNPTRVGQMAILNASRPFSMMHAPDIHKLSRIASTLSSR